MLQFDAETARQLEIAYSGADAVHRRRGSFDAVDPRPGETVVDIGCGNGMLTAELARAVGPSGRVIGVDPSEDMRATAEGRCAEFDWVELIHGLADDMPVSDGAADKAVSVQVYEYLSDIPAALREVRRVLRPGGRLVIGDNHFGTLAWVSDAPERMQRMMDAWDRHFVEREVPAVLPPILRQAGFDVERVMPVAISDHMLKPDGLAAMMIMLIRGYAKSNGLVPEDEADAWAEEQRALARDGRFFFAMTHFVLSAVKR